MNKQQIIEILTEELRTNSDLRRRLNIEEGMEATAIRHDAEDQHPAGISWGDTDGDDVALQVFTSRDDYGPNGG